MAQISVTCVIGNKTLSESAQDQAALTALIERVLKDSGNQVRPPKDWTVRFGTTTLTHSGSLASQGVVDGSTLVFTLGPSESGAT